MKEKYKQISNIVDQWSDTLPFPVDFKKKRRAIVENTYLQFFMGLTTLGFTKEEIETATGGLYSLVERRLDANYRSGLVILKLNTHAVSRER
ncbi:hypothetical protein ATN84_20290 [Paramesorhizobium deserti]|uniref:Uncharacterized protein n=1 Tax=Paramesorhizobium deserti TaxID=1494590 RepID=A0A135HPD3_9HYPH|nr:hypothetical protein [Paramesorhizobium deserti]KXF75030.1 hypothetical protein ATN84_20290 [Paramesorhizobium deserti]